MAGAPKGNKNATKDRRLITDALRRAVAQNPDKLKKACEKVLDEAVEGNLAAFTLIADRLDGKPTQPIAGDDENPVAIAIIERVIKKATD